MSLKITEEWIKERIKMDHDKLEDVKSLALPGSYHEKIGSLSTSLSNFSRLQQIDVSRNAISSLDGLSHLKYLETLNLYYNQIPDLKEVFKLRKNQSLKVLDLRLNPVTKTEPDYRLFVVHMLPLLRTLDDRPVRESERKAALMHFSNEQAGDMEDDERNEPLLKHNGEVRTSTQPRAEYVKNMVKKPTFVTEEDTCFDVIELMNRNGGDIRKERAPTGGVMTYPETEDHTHEELVKLTKKDDLRKKMQQIKSYEDTNGYFNGHPESAGCRVRENNTFKPRLHSASSTSLHKKSAPARNDYAYSADEDEAYTKYKSVANYTRHPGTEAPPPTVGQRSLETNIRSPSRDRVTSSTPESVGDEYSSLPNMKRLSFGDSNSTKAEDFVPSSHLSSSVQSRFLEEFLDLVDKYWNGSKSLHYHKKFKSLLEKPLARFEEGLTSTKDVQFRALQDKISTITKENEKLREKVQSITRQKGMESTQNGQKEQEALRSRLQLSMSDNKILRNKISELEERARGKEEAKEQHDNDHATELERQKRSLVQQVASMKFQLKNYESLDELTKMLQESHKSLISTNERLLSELDETRSRHQSEVEQLKWSYDQLRKTSQLLATTNASNDVPYTNGY